MDHEVGVGIGQRVWNASFQLPLNSWTFVTLTFYQSTGLKVYVDCQLVKCGLKVYVDCQLVESDVTGSLRFHVPVDFDQFVNIFVGQCNHLSLDQTSPGVAVSHL